MENAALVETRKKSNFSWAFLVLPPNKRHALDVLYAYCREIDDIVDETPDATIAREKLAEWKKHILQLGNLEAAPPLALELQMICKSFGVLQSDLLWILEGVEKDFSKTRYETFSELLEYCDAVASAVGLAALSIFGIPREQGYEYALSTGRALQLTNILRDVWIDYEKNRIYLPLDDMKVFDYSERDLSQQKYNSSFKRLMRFEADRAQSFYQDACLSIPKNNTNVLAAEMMRNTYQCILKNIIERDFNIFQHKVSLSFSQKVKLFTSIFFNSCARTVKGRA